MASETTRQPPSRRHRRLARALAAAIVVAALVLASFGWLAGTESGARAALSAAGSVSGGQVRAQGVHGTLAGPLRIESLTLAQRDRSTTLSDLRLDWRPRALLEKKLHVTSLHARHLRIAGTPDAIQEPPVLPERIGLPLALHADSVRIDGGDIGSASAPQIKLGPLAFALDFDGDRYRLQLRELAASAPLGKGSMSAAISGQASLSATKPYPLQGRFFSRSNAALGERSVGIAGEARLAGTLAGLSAELDLALASARVRGHAALRPFSAHPVGPAQMTAEALDAADLDPALPHTALDVRFSAAENGSGELAIENAAAGTYDERKLPLSSLQVRFRQEAGQVHFDRIVAAPGTPRRPAGSLAGTGRYADGELILTLQAEAIDLQRIDRRLRPTGLAGRIDLQQGGGRRELTIGLRQPASRLYRTAIALDAHGVLAETELDLDRAALQVGSGRVDASARIALAGQKNFSMQGKVSRFRLEDLGTFADAPQLFLNGEFTLRGERQPVLQADLAFAIADSRLAGQPLSGDGEAQLRDGRLHVPRLRLVSGSNRLDIRGRLAEGDAALFFSLDAPQLGLLGPRFGGSVVANGTVRGTLAEPRIEAGWSARGVRLPGETQVESAQGKAEIGIDRRQPFILRGAIADFSAHGVRQGGQRLKSLSAQLRFAPAPDAPLALQLHAEGVSTARFQADRVSVVAGGTTARHDIDLSLAEPGKPGQSWTAHASGELSRLAADAQWQGRITRFDAAGRLDAHLQSPARLLLSAQRIELEDFLIGSEGSLFAVDRFARDASGIATRGRMAGIRMAELLRHMTPAPPIKTDLQLGGEWDLHVTDTLSGTVGLRRERGDVTIINGGTLTLGLNTLHANAAANGGRLALQMQAEGQQLGRIDIGASTIVGGGPGPLSIAPDAPVTGSALIDVPSLRWLAPLVSPLLAADGKLQGNINASGTVGQPRFAGSIRGDDLRVAWAALGLDLRQGVLQSDFDGDQLLVRNLSFHGTEGLVTISGPIDFSGGTVAAQLDLNAQRFALFNRVDRRLTLSGDSRIALQGPHARVRGAFTVDSGFFDLGSADKPQLSDDVVIVGRKEKAPARTVSDIDVTVALGKGVSLKGRGIDAILAGETRITSGAGETPRAQGTLSIAKGTYSAYGRKLEIEQGVLRFVGPINNPALDILAMRRGQEVEAGVSVRGTALQPRVALVSEPVVPDTEKLSWLVLGHGLASAGESDAGALQAAAAALLSDSAQAGVESRIASAFGLDTLSVGTSQDSLRQRIVTLGKQISSRLYLSYQQGLESAGSVVQLRYTLSRKLSVEAEAGNRSAISLFYNIAFD